MTEVSTNDISKLQVAIARIEERQISQSAQMHNIGAGLALLATKESMERANQRIKSLEDSRTWIVRSVIGTMITSIGALVTGLFIAVRKGAF